MTPSFRKFFDRWFLTISALGLLAVTPSTSKSAEIAPQSLMQNGFHSMYNLDFSQATQDFDEWQKQHPQDPMGPVAHATALLFAEFARLGVLEAQLFVDDKSYEDRKKLTPDPKIRDQFQNQLAMGDQLAAAALLKNASDTNARFAKVLSLGLRSDYAALIEKRDLAALNYTKQGREDADLLLKEKPDAYDAYIALGVENYLTGIKPAPIRWMLQMGGMQTDKLQGIEQLQKTADHGVLLAPFAKLLLAVAAFRDKDMNKGCNLLRGLASSYPKNPLYSRELVRCH
ncbi:hypothetical protein ACPOL_5570 [Acidisarcina polymorpha]|uniref:Uncharacterized protein n=1 Tax=Acidisarcina polymorpha TaxID=2211140 RepID=A0A2Z5G732_9BACT|nr:hypothetical protein [Acidisarcina polymorpha]AXC14818.1 hypothetical protein ACPOL_5570 [Acidisarcina polymorpha]